MKFLMEKKKNADHRVTIDIPQKIINKNIVKKFIKIGKTENINGFRKGKIPLHIIQKKYGKNVYYDVLNTLMQKFFHKFINQEKLKIIGSPKYCVHQNTDLLTKDFKYSVVYALQPDFLLKDMALITVKKIKVHITDQDIKKYVEHQKKYVKYWTAVTRSIKMYDKVSINYTLFINSTIVKNFTQKKISLIIAPNIIIPELYDKIINRYINDVFFFNITFSSFHPEKKLQNTTAIFKIKIINIEQKKTKKKSQLCIQKNKNKEKTSDFIEIQKNIRKKIKDISNHYLYKQITTQLIKNNPIFIPPQLIEEEIKNLYQRNIQKYQEKEGDILKLQYHLDLSEEAKKNLHIHFIMQKIVSDQKISSNKNKIEELIKMISSNYHKPEAIKNLYNTNEFLIEKIKNIELEIQVMHILLKKINIIEDNYTFNEAMHYNWNKNNHC